MLVAIFDLLSCHTVCLILWLFSIEHDTVCKGSEMLIVSDPCVFACSWRRVFRFIVLCLATSCVFVGLYRHFGSKMPPPTAESKVTLSQLILGRL